MKLIARLLSLILAFALILPLVPTQAQAQEDTADTAVVPFQVNPLYRQLFTPEDLDTSALEDIPAAPEPNAVTYLTVAEAGAQVRKHMKNRESQFTVSFKTDVAARMDAAEQVLNTALAHTGEGDEGDYLLWQYGGWGAKISRTQSGGMYLYTVTYLVNYYTTAQQEAEVDTAVEKLITTLDLRNKSDYEKVCGVYDYLCSNVDYDYGGSSSNPMLRYTAYGALIHKKTVCQGYALLFYRLMLELGVDARLIPGTASGGEAHAWNIVELNGLYYNVDATWDANHSRYSYFLCSTKNFTKHYRHPDYETWDFHDHYPMAADNYDPKGTAKVDPVICSGSCGKQASWTLKRDHSLTIQGSGSTYDYDTQSSPAPWQPWAAGVRTLVVEEGIRGIGKSAFSGCTGLTKVNLPTGFTTVAKQAFSGCTGLTGLSFPAAFSSAGEQAFSGCTGLQEIRFLGDAPKFGGKTFENVTARLYYPRDNTTWNSTLDKNLGGNLTWVPYTAGEYTVEWKSVNTTLTGSIDLNFYVVLSDDLVKDSSTFVRFTCAGTTVDVPMSKAVPSVKNGVTRYRFSYKVFAKQLTDTVTAQVMTKSGPVGEALPYSVAKYCYNEITANRDAELVAVCKAMLNYGAAAQSYFCYRLDDLANAGLSATDRIVASFDPTPYAHSKAGSGDGIKASGAKLLLSADVAIQVAFTITGSKPIEAYTVTIDGMKAEYVNVSGSKYYFELAGIAASKFDELHAFSAGGQTLYYSVLSYANQIRNTGSADLIHLLNAMYAYHKATDAYVN